jgi:Mn-dependent DtxR family transcriptional regulator
MKAAARIIAEAEKHGGFLTREQLAKLGLNHGTVSNVLCFLRQMGSIEDGIRVTESGRHELRRLEKRQKSG